MALVKPLGGFFAHRSDVSAVCCCCDWCFWLVFFSRHFFELQLSVKDSSEISLADFSFN